MGVGSATPRYPLTNSSTVYNYVHGVYKYVCMYYVAGVEYIVTLHLFILSENAIKKTLNCTHSRTL